MDEKSLTASTGDTTYESYTKAGSGGIYAWPGQTEIHIHIHYMIQNRPHTTHTILDGNDMSHCLRGIVTEFFLLHFFYVSERANERIKRKYGVAERALVVIHGS